MATKIAVDQYRSRALRGAAVTVYPPRVNGQNGVVVTPDGVELSTSGSTTCGLQEAEDYRYENNLNLEIVGGIQETGGAIVYNCTSPLSFHPMQGNYIRINGCTLNFTSAIGSSPAVSFDSAIMTTVEMKGTQIVGFGSGPVLLFKPTNPVPEDVLAGITWGVNYFKLTTVVSGNLTAAVQNVPLIKFDCTNGNIICNEFEFLEVNGSGLASLIVDPPNPNVFMNNHIVMRGIHGNIGGANNVFQVGQTLAGGGRIINNRYNLNFDADCANTGRAVDTWEQSGRYEHLCVTSGLQSHGLYFETGAAGCIARVAQLAGVSYNRGGLSVGGDLALNQVIGLSTAGLAQYALTPSGSPWTHQNLNGQEEVVVVAGGTVTEIGVGISSTTTATGQTAGMFRLKPGMFLKITYAVAPTVTGIV